MTNKTKRRFVALAVDELSLVDTPANEKEFAVVKRLQTEEEMAIEKDTKVEKGSAEETDEKSIEKKAVGDGVEKVETEVPDTNDEAVEKAMGKVVEMVEGIVKKSEKKKEEKAEDEDEAEAEEEGGGKKKAKAEKKATPREVFEEQMKKNGVKDDALKTALEAFDDSAGVEKSEKPEEEVEKRKDDEVLEALEASIGKAKRFTPGRMDTLKNAIGTLQKLLGELTPAEKAVEEATEGALEGGLGSAVAKALKEFNVKLDGVVETQKNVGERVKEIEEARNPSASLEEDGETDTDVVETEKSLWKGVI